MCSAIFQFGVSVARQISLMRSQFESLRPFLTTLENNQLLAKQRVFINQVMLATCEIHGSDYWYSLRWLVSSSA